MARSKREYRRLPGRGRRRGSFLALTATRAGLWAGNDHLLCVFSTGYTEEYKRFYYRDIQAIITRKSNGGAVINSISALFLTFFAFLALTRTTPAVAVVWWIVAGISLLVLAFNLVLGPTCVCHVQTAVSREELPSLGRERNARKAIAILKPLIEAAQGALTPEEIGTRSSELAQQPEPAARPRPGTQAPAASGYDGRAHEALFSLLLLDGLVSGIQIFVQGLPLAILGTLFTLAFSIAVVIALTKQHGSSLGAGLRGVTWAAFVYMVVLFFTGYIIFFYEAVKHPSVMRKDQWELFKAMSSVRPSDDPVMMFAVVFSVVCAVPLGIAGLVLIKQFQAGRKAAAGVSPAQAGQ